MSNNNRVLELFRMISAVPRPSFHEEKIADFICDFVREHGFEPYRDKDNNVFVSIPATKGYEDKPAVLLQGHTDMVCEKNEGVCHDFMNEGIVLIEKDGFITADGTTLGADNGVAVAIMLYAIEGGFSAHPPIECLFTSAEEVGLIGATSFDYTMVKARRMLNMDGENENAVIVGCAGGMRSDVSFSPSYETATGKAFEIMISGLCGGHSGENIHLGRANANILMGRLLAELFVSAEVRIASIRGGSKDNAIPRESIAVITSSDEGVVRDIASAFAREIKVELNSDDKNFSLSVKEVSLPERTLDKKCTKDVLTLICSSKNGIIEMSKSLPSLVEYSRNLGVLRTEGDKLRFTYSNRSAINRQLDSAMREIDLLAAACGAECIHYARYPGWAFAGESAMADAYVEAAAELFGAKIEKQTIHAGLECGIIKSYIPDMDAISFGPNMRDLHSPDETLDVASFGRIIETVEKLLEKL